MPAAYILDPTGQVNAEAVGNWHYLFPDLD